MLSKSGLRIWLVCLMLLISQLRSTAWFWLINAGIHRRDFVLFGLLILTQELSSDFLRFYSIIIDYRIAFKLYFD